MPFSISVSENQKYIICEVTGEITLDTAREFTKELDRMSRSLKIKRFLTDVRNAQNALNTLEQYDFAYKDMAEMKLQRDVRSAILVAATDTTHDFVETVTLNAGYGVRVFHDENAAIEWLNE
jgi:SpoIIAA-like